VIARSIIGLILIPMLGLTACRGGKPRSEAPPPPVPRASISTTIDRDGGPPIPPDVSRVPEPQPRSEPLARYGNRSPYTVLGRTYRVMDSSRGYVERGIASWYGTKFHGRLTSSREPYDMYAMTAAHKTLPLPTFVRVTHLDNGRSVIVRVNDRGPFHADRIIDLSYAAAVKLGIHIQGTGKVEVRAIDPEHPELAEVPRRRAPAIIQPLYVQVGAFSTRDNAQRVARRLRDADIDSVFLDRVRVAGRLLHRVRIGPLQRVAEADAMSERLRQLGLNSITISVE
jgi:rare lipoprotein A